MILFFHFICMWAHYIVSNFSKSFKKDKVFDDDKHEDDFFENQTPQFLTFKKDYAKHPVYKDGTLKFFPPVFIQRYETVALVLQDFALKENIKKVVDFGCAEFGFFMYLKNIEGLNEILEVDIDSDLLEKYASKVAPLNSDYLMNRANKPLDVYILAGNIADFDDYLIGCDAVIAIEVIEHLSEEDFNKMPYNIFHNIRPTVAIFTTPNADFNSLFPNFSDLRHKDHRFEWNRKEFFNWTQEILKVYPDYSVRFFGIGTGPEGTENLGCCTQMAVFLRSENADFYLSAREEDEGIHKYKLIRHYEYPFYCDTRTTEEKIIHEIQYQAAHLSKMENFYNSDINEIEIPLSLLKEYVSDMCSNDKEFLNILKSSGMLLRKRNNNWFLVYAETETGSSEITFTYDDWLNEGQLNEFCDSKELTIEEKWSDEEFYQEDMKEFQSARSLEELKSKFINQNGICNEAMQESVAVTEETVPIIPLRRTVPITSSTLNSNYEVKKFNSVKSRIPLKKNRDNHVSVIKSSQIFKKIPKSCSLDSCLENINCKPIEHETCYLNLIPGGSLNRVSLLSPCRKQKVRTCSGSSLLSGSFDKAGDSGYPFSFSPPTDDLTPEQVDELNTENEIMSRSTSPSSDVDVIDVVNQRLQHDIFIEDVPVENGDLANNNRDGEGNNVEGMIGQRIIEAAERDPNDNLFFPEIEEFPLWLLNLGELALRPVYLPLSDSDDDEGVVNNSRSDFSQSIDLEDLDIDL